MTQAQLEKRGRPLVFIFAVVAGWIALRVIALTMMPDEPAPIAVPLAPKSLATGVDADPVSQAAASGARMSDPMVEGLDAAPPSHLAPAGELTAAGAAHNRLWIEASQPLRPVGGAKPAPTSVEPPSGTN